MRIGIIGAGPTGSLLATHLLKMNCPELDIVLIDKNGDIGHGLAFGTDNSEHLLNVRASNMSAFEEDPSHFLRWLWARDSPETNFTGTPPSGQAFVSRHIYGAYIESVLNTAMEDAAPDNQVTIIRQAAVDMHQGDGPIVTLGDGRALYFDRVVLCLGNFPPAHPADIGSDVLLSGRYIANPWDTVAVRRIPPEDRVLILGSGLTMVDAVQSLKGKRHTGEIRAVSRRGLLPQPHKQVRPYHALPDLTESTASALTLLRKVRAEVKRAESEGFDWRGVLDAVRIQAVGVWQALSLPERRRFLRHVRPYWDTHRHRLAPQVAADVENFRSARRLVVQAGRIHAITLEDAEFDVVLTPRGSTPIHEKFSWIINCAGPQCDYDNLPNALITQLLKRGLVRPDELRLGLDVAPDNRVVDGEGVPSASLLAIGPPTRGAFLESTAIPDIRQACARVAQFLLGPAPTA